jgi:hypothetical protein
MICFINVFPENSCSRESWFFHASSSGDDLTVGFRTIAAWNPTCASVFGGIAIWRLQCTACRAVFTVLPHVVLRYRSMSPEIARHVLFATHGGLSLERCAVLCNVSPMAVYRLVCALGHQGLVTVLTRCGLPLPTSFLADEKNRQCLAARVYLPTIVGNRVIWHLDYTEHASAATFTESSAALQRAAS